MTELLTNNSKIAFIKFFSRYQLLLFLLVVWYSVILNRLSWLIKIYDPKEVFSIRLLVIVGGALLICLTFLIPLLALKSIGLLKLNMDKGSIALRRILHLAFASPPIYVLLALILNSLGYKNFVDICWSVLISFFGMASYFYLKEFGGSTTVTNIKPFWTGWRIIHGVSALFFLFGFVLLHLFNHSAALWSTELHQIVLESLRKWYGVGFVKATIFVFIGILFLSGIRMFWYYTRNQGDCFRTLQTTSGLYLLFFLIAHLTAVLVAQANGVETDWYFATGPKGLIDGPVMLLPYYTLAVFFILLHAILGLRLILIDKKMDKKMVDRMFYSFLAISVFIALGIGVASTGVSLKSIIYMRQDFYES